jgi:hypothetical protein
MQNTGGVYRIELSPFFSLKPPFFGTPLFTNDFDPYNIRIVCKRKSGTMEKNFTKELHQTSPYRISSILLCYVGVTL